MAKRKKSKKSPDKKSKMGPGQKKARRRVLDAVEELYTFDPHHDNRDPDELVERILEAYDNYFGYVCGGLREYPAEQPEPRLPRFDLFETIEKYLHSQPK